MEITTGAIVIARGNEMTGKRNGGLSVTLALSLICSLPGQAAGQLSIRTDNRERPLVLCKAWFTKERTRLFGTAPMPNNGKLKIRYAWHAEQYAKAAGKDIRVDCIDYEAIADNYKESFTPGSSWDDEDGRTSVVDSPFLPAGWMDTPVPTETPAPAEKKPEPGLKTEWVRIRFNFKNETDDILVEVPVRYRALECMGELHIAYSLDPDHIRLFPSKADAPADFSNTDLPRLVAVDLKADVSGRGWNNLFVEFRDRAAAPALGYGCFTGQTRKLGIVKSFLKDGATPEDRSAFIDSITLTAQHLWLPNLAARNGVSAKMAAAAEKAQKAREEAAAAAARDQAETQKLNAGLNDAAAAETRRIAEMQAKYRQDVEKFNRDNAEYLRKKAANDAAVEKARVAREEYDRQIEEYRRTYGQP